MSNFEKKIEEASNDELYRWVNEYDFHVVPLASDELTRRGLNDLKNTIKNFNEESSKQTEKMIKLTWYIVCLTIVMIGGLFVQIYLAKSQADSAEVQSISERINQARGKNDAIKRCQQNPDLKESGLYNILTGQPATCLEVLKDAKN